MMGLVFLLWGGMFAAVVTGRERLAIFGFALALAATLLMFLHHATDRLNLNF